MNADPLIGQLVTPRYRLARKLGGTGLGAVYQAEELPTGNQVAIKLLLTEIRRDVELVKQFWWEARLAAASNPSRIVRVYEVNRTEDGRVFIAMEHLDGESLAELIRRDGPIEPGRALPLAIQIAQGLAAASQAGVTHRNLKPQNVMVIGQDQAKLTDFGVGRLRETALGGRPSGPGLIASEYLAPEQLKGEEVSFRADIYGLGAVLYTMLTGSVPAGQPSGPTPLTTLRPEIPDAIAQFVMRMMDRHPDRRQSGMEEVIDGLRALATLPTVEAPVPITPAAVDTEQEPSPEPSAEPPMAGLLTLLREDRSLGRVGDSKPAMPGRIDPLFAVTWAWCLAALTRARTRAVDIAPSVSLWWSRVLAWTLAQASRFSRLVAAGWQSSLAAGRRVQSQLRPYLALSWSHLTDAARGLLRWSFAAAGFAHRSIVALGQAGVAGWQRLRAGLASREPSWQTTLASGHRALAGLAGWRVPLYLSALAAVVVVGVTTWAFLDWAGSGKATRPSPEDSTTTSTQPDAALSVAALRELENERKREEARALDHQRQAALDATRRADDERRRQVELEASRRAENERRRQVELEATRQQAELEATRRAEDERRRQAELEATRRAEEERRRQAELEASRRAEEERRRQVEAEAARRAEEERRLAEAARQIARPVEPAPARPQVATLSVGDLARIRTEAEDKLQRRGLFRVSSNDRWGVAVDIGTNGDAVLTGTLRDVTLYNEAVRVVREVPGVHAVRAADVRIADLGTATAMPGDSARIRTEIQQRLRSRGLLRESSADRWGVTVDVSPAGDVTLVGVLRDAVLQGEAIRLAQGVKGVQQVKPDIRLMDGSRP